MPSQFWKALNNDNQVHLFETFHMLISGHVRRLMVHERRILTYLVTVMFGPYALLHVAYTLGTMPIWRLLRVTPPVTSKPRHCVTLRHFPHARGTPINRQIRAEMPNKIRLSPIFIYPAGGTCVSYDSLY